MTDEIDFSEDFKTGDVNRIVDKAREMYRLDLEIKRRKAELSACEERYTYISTEELPSIMKEEVNVDEIPFDNGYTLTLKDTVAGNIPSATAIKKCKEDVRRAELIDRRQEAFDWLRENDAESIISNVCSVVIPKSSEGSKNAEKIMDFANHLGLSSSLALSVHAATLNAYLKEQIFDDDGKDIPFDTFALFVGKKAIIKPPRK